MFLLKHTKQTPRPMEGGLGTAVSVVCWGRRPVIRKEKGPTEGRGGSVLSAITCKSEQLFDSLGKQVIFQ